MTPLPCLVAALSAALSAAQSGAQAEPLVFLQPSTTAAFSGDGAALEPTLHGQDSMPEVVSEEGGWRFDVAPYVWLAGTRGYLNHDFLTVPISADFGDLVKNLGFGGSLHCSGRKGQWGILADATYIVLTSKDNPLPGPPPGRTGDVTMDTAVFEVDATFSPMASPGLEFVGGLRFLGLKSELSVTGLPPASEDFNNLDPILGAQSTFPLGESWDFQLRGDIGGFGISSEFTYQLMGVFRWNFSKNWGLDFGWRMMGWELSDELTQVDFRMQGLLLGVDYSF